MRKTIFNLEDKINIKDEYLKILKVLNTKCVIYNKKNYSYFDFVITLYLIIGNIEVLMLMYMIT